MYEIMEKENMVIEDMIYNIRGVQVMLDKDVAKLYQVETRKINQVIKRNIDRFPKEFCFKLTKEETEELSLRSQIATLNKNNNSRGNNIKYLPYVLTEQGIMMLSGLLKSDIAVKVNIQIINAFVYMRKYISKDLNNNILINHENRILKLEESFNKLNNNTKVNTVFYDGQIYDAYSLFVDILNKAKKEIIIIDNYAGKELLDILKNIKTNIVVVSSNIDDTLKKKYEMQYKNVTFINNNKFHDRFIIIDKDILYTCGSSFRDLGKKCFYIGLIEDREILNKIISKLTNVQGCNLQPWKAKVSNLMFKITICDLEH